MLDQTDIALTPQQRQVASMLLAGFDRGARQIFYPGTKKSVGHPWRERLRGQKSAGPYTPNADRRRIDAGLARAAELREQEETEDYKRTIRQAFGLTGDDGHVEEVTR